MLTPNYTLSQTPDTVIVTIMVPYCSIKEMEVDILNDCLKFSCFPYYLSLTLPGNVKNNCENTSYCFISDTFEIVLDKTYPGEGFQNLEIYSKLVIDDPKPNEGMVLPLDEGCNYNFGFAMKGDKNFANVAKIFLHLFEFHPTEVALKDRRSLKLTTEQNKFNGTQYLVDFIDEDKEVFEVVRQMPPWNGSIPTEVKCDLEEEAFFRNHPKTAFGGALTPLEQMWCLNGLIDILFSYCYDRRTTYFEGTCESAWTISKLSATLCCFYAFDSTRETVVSAYRRSLIYPLFRNFVLTETVFEDLKNVLRFKRDYVLKCFLNIYDIFAKSGYYILNTLYINDYIHYIKFSVEDVCEKALLELENIQLRKCDLGLKLHLYEHLTDSEFINYPIISGDSDDSEKES